MASVAQNADLMNHLGKAMEDLSALRVRAWSWDKPLRPRLPVGCPRSSCEGTLPSPCVYLGFLGDEEGGGVRGSGGGGRAVNPRVGSASPRVRHWTDRSRYVISPRRNLARRFYYNVAMVSFVSSRVRIDWLPVLHEAPDWQAVIAPHWLTCTRAALYCSDVWRFSIHDLATGRPSHDEHLHALVAWVLERLAGPRHRRVDAVDAAKSKALGFRQGLAERISARLCTQLSAVARLLIVGRLLVTPATRWFSPFPKVLHLFQRVTDEDAELLWMDARFGRPENLIIENLLVSTPSPLRRPRFLFGGKDPPGSLIKARCRSPDIGTVEGEEGMFDLDSRAFQRVAPRVVLYLVIVHGLTCHLKRKHVAWYPARPVIGNSLCLGLSLTSRRLVPVGHGP